jgi:hypothetical protein
MIKGFVQGQTLKLAQTRVVADTIDYLIAKFHFQGEDWRNLEKWMHLQQGEQLYAIKLTEDRTQKSDHLNLGAGEWAVWLHGNENSDGVVVQRITTNICSFTVIESGALEGEVMPELPATLGEQIDARLCALEQMQNTPITVDSELSETSENPVQNKAIVQAFTQFGAEIGSVMEEVEAAITNSATAISENKAAIEALEIAISEDEKGQKLPAVAESDNGKVLAVVDGAWAAADAPSAGANITVDTELSETSENPVQNKVITAVVNEVGTAFGQMGEALEVLGARVPDASASPNGSFLQVVNGAWAAVSLTDVSLEGA